MNEKVDLAALRIDDATAIKARRPLGPRLFGLTVLLLAAGLAATFAWPLLKPARAVRTAAVRIAGDAETTEPTSATTEAVGWVEADPFPTIVRPLVIGHVATLDVLEGAVVKRGETVIATMVSAELEAARDRALAALGERDAAVARARADHERAKQELQQNAAARLRLQEAETRLANLQTRHATARERVRRAEAAAATARATLVAQQRLAKAGSSYPVALQRAQAAVDAADADLSGAEQEVAGLARELAAQRETLALCEELAEDPVELRGAVAVAEAKVKEADAALARARTELRIAERELGWATVRAPIDGVVLRLQAEPGDTVGPGHNGLVALYDPKRLRARIDVPLDSLAGIHPGQEVEIRSDAIGDRVVRGVVQRLQQETDLLKATLQVKIGLIDPPPLLRPETLCRARFLAAAREQAEDKGETPRSAAVRAFRVPQDAVRNGQVFAFDPASRSAKPISVEVLGEDGADVIVRGELSPTQRIVLESVTAGETIRERKQ